MSTCLRLAVTSGEPAGIGPDLCVDIAQYDFPCELVIIGDPKLIEQRAKSLGKTVKIKLIDLEQAPVPSVANELTVLPLSLHGECQAGELTTDNSAYVIATLQHALDGCQSGHFDGMVTTPVHKGIINDAGIEFTGHTEFLADGAGVDQVVMMLATEQLKVALATTHLPLIEISQNITQNSLTDVICIIQNSFRTQFGIEQAKIAVCGLNPHAGEGGHLGMEEIDTIIPVIERCKEQGMAVTGPWPADTIFVKEKLADYDVVLAMYHDQGLPVLKHQGFGLAVNVTLGLPFIRTSVDHGTALELAGTGQAKSSSLLSAINMAITMAKSRNL